MDTNIEIIEQQPKRKNSIPRPGRPSRPSTKPARPMRPTRPSRPSRPSTRPKR